MVGTFFILHLAGGTINLMSLGGLAIAIGLVIDDAIVVVENIHRHRAAGEPVAVAAEKGTQELVAAVIGSTLTTVVVFVPLGLLQGVVGQFFAALSLTLAAAVLLSLVYALLFIPNAAARFLRDRTTEHTATPGRGCRERYRALLRGALRRPASGDGRHAGRRPRWARCSTSGSRPASCPRWTRAATSIDYWTPTGTSLPETDRMVQAHRGRCSTKTPEVAGFARRTGAELGLFATRAEHAATSWCG